MTRGKIIQAPTIDTEPTELTTHVSEKELILERVIYYLKNRVLYF